MDTTSPFLPLFPLAELCADGILHQPPPPDRIGDGGSFREGR